MSMSIRHCFAPIRFLKLEVIREEVNEGVNKGEGKIRDVKAPDTLDAPAPGIVEEEPVITESFRNVFEEFMSNVQDSTSTIAEKE